MLARGLPGLRLDPTHGFFTNRASLATPPHSTEGSVGCHVKETHRYHLYLKTSCLKPSIAFVRIWPKRHLGHHDRLFGRWFSSIWHLLMLPAKRVSIMHAGRYYGASHLPWCSNPSEQLPCTFPRTSKWRYALTQFCVIMPQISSSSTPRADSVSSSFVPKKLSAYSLTTTGASGAA